MTDKTPFPYVDLVMLGQVVTSIVSLSTLIDVFSGLGHKASEEAFKKNIKRINQARETLDKLEAWLNDESEQS